MNDEHLRSFISVINYGSFNKAAEAKYISPQALLKQINALERDTGLQLLIRTPRGVTPTPAGREFYKGAQLALALTQDVLSRCKETEQRNMIIRISQNPHVMLLPKIYEHFAGKYPKIQQKIIVCNEQNMIDNVISGVSDISECGQSPNLSLYDLDFIPLVCRPRVCLMARTHPYASKGAVSLSELAGQKVVVNNLHWMPELVAAARQAVPGFEFEEVPCGIESVFNTCFNNGIYLMPDIFAPNFVPLISVPLDVPFRWPFGLVCRKTHSNIVQNFIEVAKEVFQNK
ncbi:MAG TPA: hypothetical protein DC001_07570 [Clostridiales bacterium]|jgi:DNA-binding transcriptional LysR family regulator|nr:hypothetical protein [Clostridiales bacterium]HBR08905.1 hypothetical protein [Clostridiales bacterium]